MPNIIFKAAFNASSRIAAILNERVTGGATTLLKLCVHGHEMLQLLIDQNHASHFLIWRKILELLSLLLQKACDGTSTAADAL